MQHCFEIDNNDAKSQSPSQSPSPSQTQVLDEGGAASNAAVVTSACETWLTRLAALSAELEACAPALQRDAAQTQRARALIASMHERLHTFAEAGDGRPAPAV